MRTSRTFYIFAAHRKILLHWWRILCPVERGIKSWIVVISSGRSQNTIPIASTQAAIKGIVQYSTTHTHTHTLAAVGSQLQSRAHAQRSRSRRACRVAHRLVTTSCTYVSAINITSFIQCIRCVQT